MTTEPDYWNTAKRVCTERELEALRLRDHRHMSTRTISLALGISRWAVRERLDSADRKILNAEKETAA
jgi:predicted DNA-binding protein (UPF0251 family)